MVDIYKGTCFSGKKYLNMNDLEWKRTLFSAKNPSKIRENHKSVRDENTYIFFYVLVAYIRYIDGNDFISNTIFYGGTPKEIRLWNTDVTFGIFPLFYDVNKMAACESCYQFVVDLMGKVNLNLCFVIRSVLHRHIRHIYDDWMKCEMELRIYPPCSSCSTLCSDVCALAMVIFTINKKILLLLKIGRKFPPLLDTSLLKT